MPGGMPAVASVHVEQQDRRPREEDSICDRGIDDESCISHVTCLNCRSKYTSTTVAEFGQLE